MNHWIDWVIRSAGDLFHLVINISILTTVLVLIILFVQRILRQKLTPEWRYALWLLLLVKLLVPWGPESDWSVYNLLTTGNSGWVDQTPLWQSSATVPDLHLEQSGSAETPDSIATVILPPVADQHAWSLYDLLIGGWLLVTCCLLLRTVWSNLTFSRRLVKHSMRPEDHESALLQAAAATLSIKRLPTLRISPCVSSPALYGLFRPTIVLPIDHTAADLSDAQLTHVFLHELAHLKRKDLLVNWLFDLLLAFHWFNPLLWYASFKMREDQEVACDAIVLRHLDPKNLLNYGQTILSLLERQVAAPPAISGVVHLAATKKLMERRIRMIKSFKQRSIGWTAIGLTALVLVSGCSLTSGKSDAETPPPTTPQSTSNDKQDQSASDKPQNEARPPESNPNGEIVVSPITDQDRSAEKAPVADHTVLLKQISQLAEQGKVPGIQFVSGKSLIEDVHRAWGAPDKGVTANDVYEVYWRGVGDGIYAFGVGRGNVIYDVRSFGSTINPKIDYSQVTFTEIKKTLGNPNETRKYQNGNVNDDILVYYRGNYQLLFVGPHDKQTLDHISVFSPKAAKPMGAA